MVKTLVGSVLLYFSVCAQRGHPVRSLEHLVVGLDRGLTYQFRILAENEVGLSEASEESDYVTFVDRLDKPLKPIVIDVGFICNLLKILFMLYVKIWKMLFFV